MNSTIQVNQIETIKAFQIIVKVSSISLKQITKKIILARYMRYMDHKVMQVDLWIRSLIIW